MSSIAGFGGYVPAHVVGNGELAGKLGCPADWIREMSGIEERHYAAEGESVVDMGVAAAQECLERTGVPAADIGMLMVASGSGERRFPGPACSVAARLGLNRTPAIDVPMASAGSLFALSLASRLVCTYKNILVVGAEKMSAIATQEPLDKNFAILFGDGAGACLITDRPGPLQIADSLLVSDGAFAEDLKLGHTGPFEMNGRSVINQAWRQVPAAINVLLERNGRCASEVDVFLMHQANQNLIDRIARALNVPSQKFYSNIARYGNTSSASLLIAASEWWAQHTIHSGAPVCFAAFGAGFHWGGLLAIAT